MESLIPRSTLSGLGIILVASLGCAKEAPKDEPSQPVQAPAQCFRSPHSVLLGQPTPRGHQGVGPGWLRLVAAPEADSGRADLADGDGKRLSGRWNRGSDQLIRVVAFDDFLRVELTLSLTGGGASGEGKAHSDATLEPDESGRGVELHRQWPFAGSLVSCSDFPP